VVAECLKKGIAKENILISLERRMKCGMGFCGHCQIGNTYVCLEGPVFSYAKLAQLNEVEL
jgi:NAD(P)H-flavin reductase